MEDEDYKGMMICLYLYERNILLMIMIIMIMLMIIILIMIMIYEFVSDQHFPHQFHQIFVMKSRMVQL